MTPGQDEQDTPAPADSPTAQAEREARAEERARLEGEVADLRDKTLEERGRARLDGDGRTFKQATLEQTAPDPRLQAAAVHLRAALNRAPLPDDVLERLTREQRTALDARLIRELMEAMQAALDELG